MKLKSKLGTLGGHTGRVVLLVIAGALVGATATAIAAVPGSDGVIHACYEVAQSGTTPLAGAPNLRIIDPSAGQSCNAPGGPGPTEEPLSWNVEGPAGPQGVAGSTGAQGATGPQGPAGAQGASGSTVSIDGQTFTLGDGKTLTGPASPVPPLQAPPGGTEVATMTLGGRGGGATSSGILAWQLVGTHGLQLVIPAGKASPILAKGCVTGKHFNSITLMVRKGVTDGGPRELVLSDAMVASYSPYDEKGKDGAGTPTEGVTFTFTKIKVTL